MQIICHGLREKDFSVEFINHEISIGSNESADITIKAVGVSGRHSVLVERDGALFVKDSGSLNSTFLNRLAVTGERKLSSGDIIQIGIQQIRVDFPSERTVTLNFISNILEEDNSEDATAMTVLADAGVMDQLKAGPPQEPPADPSQPKIIVTSTKEFFIEGRVVGKYTIVKRIGKGGMGEIYLARHQTLGTYRALKVLPRELQEDNSKFFERFIREAKLASEIRHPNVVSVMDIETDTTFGFSYIVMEYIDGGSLRKILKSNKNLPEEQAVVIVEAVASALRAAEEHGIVHRDIKPDNIMFTKQGEVKLADLGIAKNDEEDNELTKANVMIGTPAYLPPEQVRDAKTVDGRADIYSLGATFYEMLTGQHPYPGKGTYEILHKLFSDPVPDPRKINPEISSASAAIVMKMLAKDPNDRFQSAGELLDTIGRTFPPHTANESAELIKKLIAGVFESNTTFHSGISMTHFARRERFKKNLYWSSIALLCAGCAGGALYYLIQSRGQQPQPVAPNHSGIPKIVHISAPSQVSNVLHVLHIKTTPDSEIRFISPDGLVKVYSSGPDGLLKISGLHPGNYRISISRNNFHRSVRDITLKGDMTLHIPLKADLKRLVIKARPGSVIKVSGGENREQSITVPETGIAVLPGLREDMLNIRVSLPGWETYDRTLQLSKDHELQIPQKRILAALTIRTVPFADILLKRHGKTIHSTKANSLGVAVFDGVPTGEYRLAVFGKGCRSREITCALEQNRTVNVELRKITYVLSINAAADTKVMLFFDHRLLGTYLVPENGRLRLPDMPPGNYSITAEKKGMVGKRFAVLLDKDKTVDCRLADSATPAAPKAPRPVPRPGTVADKRPTGIGVSPSGKSDIAPNKRTGVIKVYFLASEELMDYVSKNGVEISIGSKTWFNIRQFPWSQSIPAGKYQIRAAAAGIKELRIPQFTITADRVNECLLEPVTIPSRVRFVSNRKKAIIVFNGVSCKPGDEVACETFRQYTVTATYKGEKLSKTFRSETPGDKLKLDFFFADKAPPMQDQYDEGMKLFAERNFKEALKILIPVAEAGHKEAARKVAEIYEQGLGMWFSNSSEALKWYRKTADLGDADAACKVAQAIDRGDLDGTAAQMLEYYLMAASLNRAEVFYRLSVLFKDGYKEIQQDDARALHFLRLAAESGHPDAMFDLGMRYENGHGVTLNIQTALRWINRAADAGHEKAKRHRSNIMP